MFGPLIAFLLMQLSVVLHELGHAITMRKMGVEIESFGIGYPFPKIPRLCFSIRGIRVLISPLCIGGFVKPTTAGIERMKSLSYDEQALINGAGIITNILLSGIIFIGLIHAKWFSKQLRPPFRKT